MRRIFSLEANLLASTLFTALFLSLGCGGQQARGGYSNDEGDMPPITQPKVMTSVTVVPQLESCATSGTVTFPCVAKSGVDIQYVGHEFDGEVIEAFVVSAWIVYTQNDASRSEDMMAGARQYMYERWPTVMTGVMMGYLSVSPETYATFPVAQALPKLPEGVIVEQFLFIGEGANPLLVRCTDDLSQSPKPCRPKATSRIMADVATGHADASEDVRLTFYDRPPHLQSEGVDTVRKAWSRFLQGVHVGSEEYLQCQVTRQTMMRGGDYEEVILDCVIRPSCTKKPRPSR